MAMACVRHDLPPFPPPSNAGLIRLVCVRAKFLFQMEYKGLNASQATERVVARVNELLAVTCTEEMHVHPSCRECTKGATMCKRLCGSVGGGGRGDKRGRRRPRRKVLGGSRNSNFAFCIFVLVILKR